MRVNCQYCHHSFNLSRDYIEFALAEAAEKKQKYVSVECVNCRKYLKISVKQMSRFAPKPTNKDE